MKVTCETCKAERNEPFCQACNPTSGTEVYTPRHDGFAAYEDALNSAADKKASDRKKAEREGDLVDIFDKA